MFFGSNVGFALPIYIQDLTKTKQRFCQILGLLFFPTHTKDWTTKTMFWSDLGITFPTHSEDSEDSEHSENSEDYEDSEDSEDSPRILMLR